MRTGTAVALLGGASRASTFVLVALYFQQVLAMSPQQAGLAMVPTSLTGFAVSLTVLPRLLGAIGPARSLVLGLVVLAAGHLWLAYVPTGSGYVVAVLPGLLLVATGVALSFTPTTMVLASAVPGHAHRPGLGLAGAAMQVGGALGTAAFIVVGVAAGRPGRRRPRHRGVLRGVHGGRDRGAPDRRAGSDARASSRREPANPANDRGEQAPAARRVDLTHQHDHPPDPFTTHTWRHSCTDTTAPPSRRTPTPDTDPGDR